METKRERKPPMSVVLPDDLRKYLQQKADEGYRSLTRELIMRLEQTRQADLAQAQANEKAFAHGQGEGR